MDHCPTRDCAHVAIARGEDELMKCVSEIFELGMPSYFPEDKIDPSRTKILAYQLQRLLAYDVPSEAVSRLSSWTFSVVYDSKVGVFVPIYKHPGKQHECQMCRGVSERLGECQHERVCRNTENLISELNPEDYEENQAVRDAVNTHQNNDMEDTSEAMTNASKLPALPPLMCKFILAGAERLARKINERDTGSTLKLNFENCPCETCGNDVDEKGSQVILRELFLTTLTQGTVVIAVEEWQL